MKSLKIDKISVSDYMALEHRLGKWIINGIKFDKITDDFYKLRERTKAGKAIIDTIRSDENLLKQWIFNFVPCKITNNIFFKIENKNCSIINGEIILGEK